MSQDQRPNAIAPLTRQDGSLISPAREQQAQAGGAAPSVSRPTRATASLAVSPRRGRSLERQPHPVSNDHAGVLNQVGERELAPSRSRHRREQRDRERKEREGNTAQAEPIAPPKQAPISPSFAENPQSQIMPSWSRRSSTSIEKVSEVLRRNRGSSGVNTPASGDRRSPREEDKEKAEELRKASKQLGQVFGVAAG